MTKMTKAQAKRAIEVIRAKMFKLLGAAGYTASPIFRKVTTKDFEDVDKVVARIGKRLD